MKIWRSVSAPETADSNQLGKSTMACMQPYSSCSQAGRTLAPKLRLKSTSNQMTHEICDSTKLFKANSLITLFAGTFTLHLTDYYDSYNLYEACRCRSRLMTMSPLYPCGKPCSRGTHNETVKTWPSFLQSSMEL